jgi:hypothetical protein
MMLAAAVLLAQVGFPLFTTDCDCGRPGRADPRRLYARAARGPDRDHREGARCPF